MQIGTRKLTLEIDGVEYTATVSNCTINGAAGESDFVTFADANSGGLRDYTLGMTLAQDLAVGSLWREMWDNVGADVPATIAPYGNAVPAADMGHMTGTVTITEPDGVILGGEANASNSARQTVEVVWAFTARPVLVESVTP